METIVTTEQMNSLKALSDTNMKISDAKALLIKIEETKQQYFKEREDETRIRIATIVSESAVALEQARENYYETTQFYNTVSAFAESLNGLYTDFSTVVAGFEEEQTAWEEDMKKQESILSEIRNNVETDKIRIENDRKGIEAQQKLINEDRIRINDMRGTIEREITRIRIKNNA